DSKVAYDKVFESVKKAKLLILDDLGSQSSTPWAQEKLFQLLNYRYNAQLPTVITSNVRLPEQDPRIRSRMADRPFSDVHVLGAPSYAERTNDSELNRTSLDRLPAAKKSRYGGPRTR